MSDGPSPTDIHNMPAYEQLESYVNALTDEEKTEFLLSILSDYIDQKQDVESTLIESAPIPRDPEVQSTREAPPGSRLYIHSATARKKNLHRRCGCGSLGTCNSETHGTSFVSLVYNSEFTPENRYEIVVRINHYGRDYYGTGENAWGRFINAPSTYKLFISTRLFGPNNNTGGGYFQSGNNQTPGDHFGTLGIEVFKPGTDEQVWWGLWYFHDSWPGPNNWGNQWLRCGHDYLFSFHHYRQ